MKSPASIKAWIELTVLFGAVVLMLGVLGGGLGVIASFIIWPLIQAGTVQANSLGINIATGVRIGALIGVPVALCVVLRELASEQRRGRVREGCCIRCGYNLTGLPEPRCPECGQPFEPKGDQR